MYVKVALETSLARRMLLVPGDTVVTRSDGAFVAVIGKDSKVTFRKIDIGRDYGTELEAIGGVVEGDMVVVNPSDDVKNGVVVRPMARQTARPSPKP